LTNLTRVTAATHATGNSIPKHMV